MADPYELKSIDQHVLHTELGQNVSRVDLDNLELTRLGKKPVLIVSSPARIRDESKVM